MRIGLFGYCWACAGSAAASAAMAIAVNAAKRFHFFLLLGLWMAERGIVNFSLVSRNPWRETMNRTVNTVLALLAAGMAGAAQGQAFPSKPIKVVVPFVAGGSSDIVGRAIAAKFQEYLGQPGVVENKPGANGSIAAEFVARADADGYTILVGSIGVFSINAALFKDLRYNPVRRLSRPSRSRSPRRTCSSQADAHRQLDEGAGRAGEEGARQALLLLERYGVIGPSHRRAAQAGAGIQAGARAPTKGGAACQTDIMGNQVDYSFQNLGAVTNYIKAGKMKALAVTAKGRHPQLPNVPDAAEAGFPDLVVTSWQAVAAPGEDAARSGGELHDAAVRALREPDDPRAHDPDRLRRGGRHARGVRQVHEAGSRPLDDGGEQGRHQAGIIMFLFKKRVLINAIRSNVRAGGSDAREARSSPRTWSPPT
jgi:tripartite-type tricarboxylate transporter receptor subunit TctC